MTENISCFYYIIKIKFLWNKSSAWLTILFATRNRLYITRSWVYHSRQLSIWKLYISWWTKDLQIFETLVKNILVKSNLWEKLVSSLEFRTTFDERYRANSVPFIVIDFRLLGLELESFVFKLL